MRVEQNVFAYFKICAGGKRETRNVLQNTANDIEQQISRFRKYLRARTELIYLIIVYGKNFMHADEHNTNTHEIKHRKVLQNAIIIYH